MSLAKPEPGEIVIAARVSKTVYAKILKRRQAVRQLTGIDPSLSALVRAMIEESVSRDSSRRRRRRGAAQSARAA